jgi:predicted ATP-binding protein involved in virulence
LELVEFGMDDVKTSIDRVMHDLSSTLRQGLNQLTGNFLKEVVRREYREVDLQSVTNTEMSSVDAVLDRVGENLFSSDDKVRLKEIIKNVRNMDEINNEDKVILQFLLKLLALHEQQKLKESSVNKFVKVCNDYLISKHLVYDSQKFEVRIEQERISSRSQPSKVYLSDLSSGEKQIISLFAHIYLGTRKDYFVIIDEPELSLSVKWQKRFLPDVWATEKCRALVAVTHSPFIFDNSLRTYTHGIEEFWIKK